MGIMAVNLMVGFLEKTLFGHLVINNELKLPPPDLLPYSYQLCPYFIVGDDALPLRNNLLRPYPRRSHFLKEETIYNYRLTWGRHVVENAKKLRDDYKIYLCNEGAVLWKNKGVQPQCCINSFSFIWHILLLRKKLIVKLSRFIYSIDLILLNFSLVTYNFS